MPELSAATPSPNEPGLGADQLLDTLPWGLLAVSAAGLIRRLNRQAAIWWGLPAEAALGQTIGQMGPGQLPALAYAALAHAASEPMGAAECYLPRTEQWVTLTSAKQPTGELLVHWQDITAQKQREQQYQALAENIPDVLTRWDPGLRLLYANAAFAAKNGAPLSELLGRTNREMDQPEEVAAPYMAALQQVFDTGQPQEHYHTLLSPQGVRHYHSRLVPELRDGQIETVLGIARDISELRRTEAETLRLREALGQQATDRYQALLYAMDEGFCVIELTFDASGQQVVDYVYRELNPVFAQQSGLPAEALGQSVRELVPDLEPLWFDLYGRVARTGEPVRLEHEVPQLGRWFEMHACRVGGPGSQQVAVLFNDITARKQQAQHQQFLLQLSDTLRAETGVAAVGNRAVQLIAEQLGADRVYLVTLTADDDTVVITHETRRADLPPLQGAYRSSDFPSAIKELFEHTIVYNDVRTDARLTEQERLSFAGLSAVGFIAAPIRRGSEAMIWAAGALSTQPRSWTAPEIALFEDAVERTWAAVERARAEQALRASEANYRTLFESIDEGFCVIELQLDEQGSAVDWLYQEANPAFEKQTGYVDAVGQRISDLQPDLERAWFEQFAAVARTGEPTRFVQASEAMKRWYDVYAFRVGEAGEHRVALLFTDISDRKRREASAALLNEVSEDLAQLTNIDDTLNALGEKLAAHLGLSACLYAELFEAAQIAVIAHGWQRADMPNLLRTYRTTEFMSDEIRELCLTGQPVIIRDVFADPRTDGAQYAAIGIGSFVGMPLVRDGEWRFLLVVYRPEPSDWREEEIDLIRELTTRIWTRLERARAEDALHDREARLRVALDAADLGTFVWHVADDRNEEDARTRVHFGLALGSTISLAEALATTLHPDDAPRYAAAVAHALDPAGPGRLHQEFRIRHPAGERWLAVTGTTAFEGTPPWRYASPAC